MNSKTCHELLFEHLEKSQNPSCISCKNKACRLQDSRYLAGCLAVDMRVGESSPRTLEKIGDIFDVCRMRICQIEKKAKEKILDLNSSAESKLIEHFIA